METRVLGKTGLKVSLLGFGASPLGDEFRKTTSDERQQAVDAAIDAGINFFDVSPYYGRKLAEQRLGETLGSKRSRIILATKCGRYETDGFDFSAKRVTASIDESLERLRTDYVDLLQAHDVEFGDYNQIVEETIPALRKIQQSGKARYIGITGFPLTMMRRIAEAAPVDTFLSYCRYNLMINDMDQLLTPYAQANGIGLINASPLHMGLLTERGAPAWHPAPPAVKEASAKVVELCRQRGVRVTDVALRFCVEHHYVATTLVGLSRSDHVASNVRCLAAPLDADLLAEIAALVAPAANTAWPSGRPENNDYDFSARDEA